MEKVLKIFNSEIQKSYEQVDGNFVIEGLILTSDKDLTGDIITEQAIDKALTYFQRYTTVLFNHDPNRPIGKLLEIFKISEGERKGLKGIIQISKTETEIIEKIKEGVLSSFSFAGLAKKEPIYEGEKLVGHYIVDLVPVEVSVVSVPANPNAKILDFQEKSLTEELVELMKSYLEVNKELVKEVKQVQEKAQKEKPVIVINREDVDERPWMQVDKIKQRNILYEAGNKTAIDEMYLIVRSYERMTDWKYPHHYLKDLPGNKWEMVLSYTGLMAAYKAWRGARGGGKDRTPEEKREGDRHLVKHFRFLKRKGYVEEIPEPLRKVLDLYDLIENIEDKELYEVIEEKLNDVFFSVELKDYIEEEEEEKMVEIEISEEVEKKIEQIVEKKISEALDKTVEKLSEKVEEINKAIEKIPVIKGEDTVEEDPIEKARKALNEINDPNELFNILRQVYDRR